MVSLNYTYNTFNAIPNVDVGKNKVYVGDRIVVIPTGSYEIEDIDKYVQTILAYDGITINIKPNNKTLLSEDSSGQLLGFTPRVLEANKIRTSDLSVAILKVNDLRVECNIATGA